jgi:uncharacterized membrane protein
MILKSAKHIFKKYVLAGTAVVVPLIGTFLILRFIIVWIDRLFISLLPDRAQPEALFGMDIPGIGLLATLIIIILVGVLTRLYIGKWFVRLGDKIMANVPLVSGIYASIKQLMTSVVSASENKFKSVVAVEFPRKGAWAIGFVTGDAAPEFEKTLRRKHIYVFVPTTPMPTNGYLVIFPEDEVMYLDMPVDDAIKLIISGGMIQDKN